MAKQSLNLDRDNLYLNLLIASTIRQFPNFGALLTAYIEDKFLPLCLSLLVFPLQICISKIAKYIHPDNQKDITWSEMVSTWLTMVFRGLILSEAFLYFSPSADVEVQFVLFFYGLTQTAPALLHSLAEIFWDYRRWTVDLPVFGMYST